MVTQTVEQEREWWRSAPAENIWNGPGDGLDQLEMLEPVAEFLQNGPERIGGKWALDLGCGNGRLLVPMAERFPETQFIGADIAPREFPSPGNVGRLALNGRSLDLIADEMLDVAWSVLLFQHLPPEAVDAYLAELGRVLRFDGVVVIQWVENGGPDTFLHYSHTWAEMTRRCNEAGLFRSALLVGESGWTWATLQKIA